MSFPEGLAGDVVLRGRGRDLITRADGSTVVAGVASFEASVDFAHGQRVTRVLTTPPIAGIDALVGRSAGGGYRKHLGAIVGELGLVGSLEFQLLDDLSGASLVSGYAPQLAIAKRDEDASAGVDVAQPDGATEIMLAMSDVCAGWRAGGTIMTAVESAGRPPMLQGPIAPGLDDAGDSLAWHDPVEPMTPNAMRRIRRVDVAHGPDFHDLLVVSTMFRDTHMGDDGAVTIVHEYELAAEIDPTTFTVSSIDAAPRVLPYPECPEAAVSAQRLVGTTTAGLRTRVRAELIGASTCTHLNDVVRALEDVEVLAATIRREETQ